MRNMYDAHRCGFGARRSHLYSRLRESAHENFGFRRPKYNVPMNIIESDTQYEVHIYATGFAKENIKLSIVDDVLLVSGTRTVDENNLPNFIHQEFPIRSFERMISLRGQVDNAGITAKHEDGILKITLPKTAQAQKPAQEIQVV